MGGCGGGEWRPFQLNAAFLNAEQTQPAILINKNTTGCREVFTYKFSRFALGGGIQTGPKIILPKIALGH